ncbi:IclR family transcriptional regulator [Streptomyces sp. NPDC093589]|uniref:IclR family transcriptional regulator n=1 Tax=Streptomyces sp. NPDC093589 TaxID=3366043 RepID=UPI00380C0838
MTIVPAAAQVLAVLRYLAKQAAPVPAAAIARDVGLPRSTTYHLLDTLASDGFVVHLPEERRYGLGVSAFELASGYERQAPFQRLARVPLATLVDRTGHNANLAVLHGREVIYVIEERAPGRAPLVSEVGVRLPAQLTASGRALLAHLPAAQVRALFPDRSAFVLRNDAGPTSLSALRPLLTEVRRRGYATEEGEITGGLSSVAAPVLDHLAHPIAGVSVTFPGATADAAERERIAGHVTQTARELIRRIGGFSGAQR